ncbi:MAG: hypothetical protein KJ077_28900 [Anaerolineae bacterium]|nr:hypothetical protein [Anaerolineae bacterium]
MKNIFQWLLNLLGWGVPGILMMSGSLTGTGGSSGSGQDPRKFSKIKELRTRLDSAELDLNNHQPSHALYNLERADEIVQELHTHTPEVENLLDLKKQLWERYHKIKKQP